MKSLSYKNTIVPKLIPNVTSSLEIKPALNQTEMMEQCALRLNILNRDKFVCRFCGFQSRGDKRAPLTSPLVSGYFDTHPLDFNRNNQDPNNLVAICPFCQAVFDMNSSVQQDKITPIYFPWMKQEDLNLLVLCLGIAIHRDGDSKESAISLLKWLESHNSTLNVKCGEGFAQSRQLYSALSVFAKQEPILYKKRSKIFDDLKILINISQFKDQIKYWSMTSFLTGKNWEFLWKGVYKQWGQQNNPKK
jgi:hypothetical protein